MGKAGGPACRAGGRVSGEKQMFGGSGAVPGTDVQGQTSREGHSVWNGELGTYIWAQSQDGWLGGSSWPRQILPNREVWEHRLPEHSKR